MLFDPTSKQFQVSDSFQPDKESTWDHPAVEDGWMHAHNALRGEMKCIQEALGAMKLRDKSLQNWEIKAIQNVSFSHFEHIHSHHSNEDDLFVPELRKRIHFPEKLVTDHVGLVEKLTVLDRITRSLKEGDAIDGLIEEWDEYVAIMLPHLKEEEDIGLPLMRAYFTPKDITPIIQKLVANSPRIEMGSLIFFMGPDKFRHQFMKQEGIPLFVWYIDFKAKYRYFVTEFIDNVVALKIGTPPAHQRKSWWSRFLDK